MTPAQPRRSARKGAGPSYHGSCALGRPGILAQSLRMSIPLTDVLERAGAFFTGKSPIHVAAQRTADALDAMGIPFAIAGALAANVHGHVRTTEDVDVLLTPEGLARFEQRWLGRGWEKRVLGSRGLRHAETNQARKRDDRCASTQRPGRRHPAHQAEPAPPRPRGARLRAGRVRANVGCRPGRRRAMSGGRSPGGCGRAAVIDLLQRNVPARYMRVPCRSRSTSLRSPPTGATS